MGFVCVCVLSHSGRLFHPETKNELSNPFSSESISIQVRSSSVFAFKPDFLS